MQIAVDQQSTSTASTSSEATSSSQPVDVTTATAATVAVTAAGSEPPLIARLVFSYILHIMSERFCHQPISFVHLFVDIF